MDNQTQSDHQGPIIHPAPELAVSDRAAAQPPTAINAFKPTNTSRITIVVLVILLLASSAASAYFFYQRSLPPTKGEPEGVFSSPTTQPSNTNEDQVTTTYTHPLGFSFQHDSSIPVTQNRLDTYPHLMVQVHSLDQYEDAPGGFTLQNALADQQALAENRLADISIDWPVKDSEKLTPLTAQINAREFLVLSRFDACDVTFERKLIFYHQNHQIVISYIGDPHLITTAPSYSTSDPENCGNKIIWDFTTNAQARLNADLTISTAPQQIQSWYNNFDSILSTFKFNEPIQNSNENWQNFNDPEMGFAFKYPPGANITYTGNIERQFTVVHGDEDYDQSYNIWFGYSASRPTDLDAFVKTQFDKESADPQMTVLQSPTNYQNNQIQGLTYTIEHTQTTDITSQGIYTQSPITNEVLSIVIIKVPWEDNRYEPTISQILSTFKFIE